ncbi:hypothetical protein LJC31_06440 [Synergistaceae bacterium OttesenSCG-928-I11]|nr:hypothetical protein [Synergistaceae bacterium OttesenSCG-928-I11]
MRDGNREYLYAKLDEHFPGIKEKYIRRYGTRYKCPSPDTRRLWDIFRSACREHGILYDMGEIVAASRARFEVRQRELF